MMVMPYMENGSAPTFLRADGRTDPDCARIVSKCLSWRATTADRLLLALAN